jgi:uncharacterized phage-associated protein
MTTYKALGVANEIIAKGSQKQISITPMKLQKLVYYAHALHLAIHGTPLIEEDFMAWKFGPVENSIYNEFKIYGYNQIQSLGTILSPRPDGQFVRIAPRIPKYDISTTNLINDVLDIYGEIDARVLSDMTHQDGSPWALLYEQHHGGAVNGIVIPDELIKHCTRAELRQQ